MVLIASVANLGADHELVLFLPSISICIQQRELTPSCEDKTWLEQSKYAHLALQLSKTTFSFSL